MKIYIGRWDLLPKSWPEIEGHGLFEKTEMEIKEEVKRQRDLLPSMEELGSYSPKMLINCYTPEEFEETFNNDLEEHLNTEKYWIRIFPGYGSVEDKLNLCLGILKDITCSGYIPFASACPSSTEVEIKAGINRAVSGIKLALAKHQSIYRHARN